MRTMIVLVIAAALAATASAATPAAWVKQADAICTQGNAAQKQIPQPKTQVQLLRGLTLVHSIVVRQIRELAALPEPAALKARIERMLRFAADGNGYVGVAVIRLRSGKTFRPLLAQAARSFAAANRVALQLGAIPCGK